jgi:transposase
MPPPIPEDKRLLVKTKIHLTEKPKEIEKNTGVSRRTVQQYRKNLIEYGTVRPPKTGPQGRPRIITPAMEEVCFQIPPNDNS